MHIQTFVVWVFSLKTTIINSTGWGGRISSFSPEKPETPASPCPGIPWMGDAWPHPTHTGNPTARKGQPMAFDPCELMCSARIAPISWTCHLTGKEDRPDNLDPQLLEEVTEVETGLCASLPSAHHLPRAPCSTSYLSCGSSPPGKLMTKLMSQPRSATQPKAQRH